MENLKPSLQKRQKHRDKRLGEELIECYRIGVRYSRRRKSWDAAKRYKTKTEADFEGTNNKENMKVMHGGGSKFPSDNLEPLIRFLNTHTGKHWDKIYSELSQKINKNTMTGLHVFQHLFDFVETKVFIENKKVFSLNFSYQRSGTEKYELVSYEKYPKFYVHPKTGILLKARMLKRKKTIEP
jgi:hypothetical protein